MAMQSQTPRSSMAGYGMKRRKGLGKPAKVLILLAVTAAGAFFFWGGDDGTADDPGVGDIPADTAPRLAGVNDAGPNEPTPTPNAVPPAVLDFGRSDPAPQIKPNPTTPSHSETAERSVSEAAPPVEPKPNPTRTESTRPQPRPFVSGADAATLYNRGDQLIAEGDLVGGRTALSRLLFAPDLKLADGDAMAVRNRLNDINAELFWSPDVTEGDPITRLYKNEGLLMGSIGPKFRVPYQLLEIINGIPANRLQADHVLKVVQGPLHARVIKHQFIMDLYALDPQGLPVYICSFPVGLGENDKTPPGNWQVTKGSKVDNPSWRDDETGEFFTSDDPKNPIGDFWIAIHGLDESNKNKRGFGIHGTIEPESIGQEASRGCIRLKDADIKLVFSMLTDHSQGSTIQIVQ